MLDDFLPNRIVLSGVANRFFELPAQPNEMLDDSDEFIDVESFEV